MIIMDDRTITTQVKLRSVTQKAKLRDARQDVDKFDKKKVFLALKKCRNRLKSALQTLN